MADTKFTPGPWVVGYKSLTVGIRENAKIGGFEKLFDVRGWGYFTGLGHGALGMSAEDATTIQNANAHLIAAAPELYEAAERAEFRLESIIEFIERHCSGENATAKRNIVLSIQQELHTALAKARGEAA